MRFFTAIFLIIIILPSAVFALEAKYTCPMHPHIISDVENTCPICGMNLEPLEFDEEPIDEPSNHNKTNANSQKPAITISSKITQAMGVQTEKLFHKKFGTIRRSFGIITRNEDLEYEVSTTADGWIRELRITSAGDRVKAGQKLYALYSPELISAQAEYLNALKSKSKTSISAAEKYLELLGVHEKTITELKRRNKPFDNLAFLSNEMGMISEVNVRDGAYVDAGDKIATIQNYSEVWVAVSVSERDLDFIDINSDATITFPRTSKEAIKTKIDYIYPSINPKTRTGKIRLVLDNEDGALKIGSYVDVEFEVDPWFRLAVANEAILHDSRGKHVIVSLGNGKFQPKSIVTGVEGKLYTEVISGVKFGNKIVTSAQFLIDSESTLKESFSRAQKPKIKPRKANKNKIKTNQ